MGTVFVQEFVQDSFFFMGLVLAKMLRSNLI